MVEKVSGRCAVTYAESGAGSVGPDYGRPGGRAASVETVELAHDDVRGQLADLLDDSLDETQTARVQAHLAQCRTCAAYLVTLRKTVDLLGALPTKAAPEPLRQRLLTIPDAEQAPPA